MNHSFRSLKLLRELVALGERQFDAERQAAALIVDTLQRARIPCEQQSFVVDVPACERASLVADGVPVPCRGCSTVSGSVEGKEVMVSSAMPSIYLQDKANINFNPYCSSISRGNYYRAPAVAVSHDGVQRILSSHNVRANVETTIRSHESCNILVGNVINPTVVCFAHFDSIGPGAVDNASGVSVMMDVIITSPDVLRHVLVVFSGAEELSTDVPYYWGYGFRILQSQKPFLFDTADCLLVVDCVGNASPTIVTDRQTVSRAFPIHHIETYAPKIQLIVGDIDHLMTVYHSDIDDGRGLKQEYLDETSDCVMSAIWKAIKN